MFAGRLRRGFRAGLAVCCELFGREGLVVAGIRVGTAFAERSSIETDFAVVVDAFAADLTSDAHGFVAGHLASVNGNRDPLFTEEVGVRHFAVGEHLLLIFVFDRRGEIAGALSGGFKRGYAYGLIDGGVALRRERC